MQFMTLQKKTLKTDSLIHGHGVGGGGGVRNMNPFTAAQWQEFQQQALIYKYMLSGLPVPPHLLLSISPTINCFFSTLLSPPQSSTLGGWGENDIVAAGGMNYGRRIDPEPGRCRRTDGKKWRCSKEAHPESRYCERHMHRGRNRTTNNSCSRKPVEFPTSTTPPPPQATIAASSSIISPSLSHDNQNTLLYHSLRPPHFFSSSSSSRPPTTQHHFLDPTIPFSQQHNDHRYLQGMRDIQGETDRAFPHDPYTTPRMNQSHPFDFHSLMDKSKQEQNEHHEEQGPQHCYVLGTDIKTAPTRSSSISGLEARGGDQDNRDKPFHHFFSDCPQPSSRRDSTTCIDDFVGNQLNLTSTSTSPTTTQLSISMPLSTQDFFQSKPSPYW